MPFTKVSSHSLRCYSVGSGGTTLTHMQMFMVFLSPPRALSSQNFAYAAISKMTAAHAYVSESALKYLAQVLLGAHKPTEVQTSAWAARIFRPH